MAATFASIAGLLGLLPGTMGITLGRNPDGVSADLARRLAPLRGSRPALVGLAAARGGAGGGAGRPGVLSGWWAFIVGFVAPFLVARVLERSGPRRSTSIRSTSSSCSASTDR